MLYYHSTGQKKQDKFSPEHSATLPPCWSCKGQKEKPPRSSTRRPEPATGPNVGATWACGTSRARSGNRGPICDIPTSRCGGDMLSLRHKATRMILGENGKAVTRGIFCLTDCQATAYISIHIRKEMQKKATVDLEGVVKKRIGKE